jgi:tetratricopeptide (TPR) repeat protein
LAQAIAREIQIKITPQEKARLASSRPINPEAHEANLKGWYWWNKYTGEGFEKAISHFERAIKIDPSYAAPYAGLADCYITLAGPVTQVLPPREAMPKARAAVTKALELDEKLAEAHCSLGRIKLFYDQDWAGSEKDLKRAIELNPHLGNAHSFYGLLLCVLGRHEEAVREAKRGKELDPLLLNVSIILGTVYYMARHFDLAIEQLRKTAELDPHFGLAHAVLMTAYISNGMPNDALEEHQRMSALSRDPLSRAWLGWAFGVAGRREEAISILRELEQAAKSRYVPASAKALIYIGIRDYERALEAFELAFQAHDSTIIFLKVDPMFDGIRSDPRFQDLLRRMNFLNY